MFLELKASLNKEKFTSTIVNDGDELVNDEGDELVNDEGDELVNDEGDELVNDEGDELVNEVNDPVYEPVIHNAHQEIVQEQVPGQEQEIVQEIVQEIIQEPTVMSFSFLSTMNHIEPSLMSHSIEEITDEVNELDDTNNDETNNDETKIIKSHKFDNCTVKELKDILNDKKLPTSGNKSKLIQRIVENGL